MDFFNATTMPWYGSIPSGCCHLVHDSTVHSRLFLELSSAAQNGVKLFLIFCTPTLMLHENMLSQTISSKRIIYSMATAPNILLLCSTPSPWLTRIRFTRISLTRIFKKFPFLT